jgi:hypothetical protein
MIGTCVVMGGSTLGREEAILLLSSKTALIIHDPIYNLLKVRSIAVVDSKRKYYGRSNYEELEEG